jgi:16S rRNA processing protein RimM
MPETKRVTIGQIVRSRGIKGEMVVVPLTDDPSRFLELKEVTVTQGEITRQFRIEGTRKLQGNILMKLKGIQVPEEAKNLVGGFIEIETDDLVKLPEGKYFIFEIVGLEVRNTKGEKIGVIKEVISLPANDVYVVRGEKRDYDIPAIREVVKKIDVKNKVMIIAPITGLLEL